VNLSGDFAMRQTLVVAVVLVGLSMLAGCTTYSNVPAQPGDIARNDPNDAPVRQIMAAALEAVAADQPMERLAIVLPAGTSPANYDWIVPQVSKGAMWSAEPLDPSIPVLEVRQVRLRTWRAQVDIIRPFAADPSRQELVTVYLKTYGLGDWAVTNLRVWRGSLEDALRESAQLETDVAP
jgi:hypothetical protein